MFFLTRNGDHTLATWDSAVDGTLVSAYIDQDWRFQAIPNADSLLLLQPIRITQNGSPYHLVLWPNDGQALPSPLPGSTPADPLDQARLALLTGALPEVTTTLNNPPPNSPVPTSGNGPATGEYFRITELAADSDADGIYDWHEFNLGLSPVSADTDGNGLEDPWDGISNTLVVAEYQAENRATLPDGDGDYEDWVEILNPTTSPILLNGWRLTDKPGGEPGDVADLAKWSFPDGLSLQPGESLLIWASNKGAAGPALELHTNFRLDPDNEGIGIVNPAGVLVDSHRWTELQVEDRSAGWGIDNFVDQADGRTRKLRYFGEPTPGELNKVAAFIGVCGRPIFSVPGGIYASTAPPGGVSISLPVGSAGSIRFTTDFSVPDQLATLYSGSLNFSNTTIIRAQATSPDCFPSPVVTASYLFKEDVLGTAPQGTLPTDHQVKPPGYPEETSALIPPGNDWYRIDYDTDPFVIQTNKNALLAELDAIPSVSIVLPTSDFFDKVTGGIYANASISSDDMLDPQGAKWERLASIEYADPTDPILGPQWYQETGRLRIAGNSSVHPRVTPKHGMRIDFRKTFSSNPEGVMLFGNEPLSPSPLKKFRTLMVRPPTQDSWLFRSNPMELAQATYAKESWVRDAHAAMGLAGPNATEHPIAHQRWVHLFVNGLYWGIYGLGERINEDYMQAYEQADGQYDVIKPTDEAEDGDTLAWEALKTRVSLAAADPTNAAKWTAVEDLLDVDNYIDYLMVQMFVHVSDWPIDNWRIARRKDLDDPQAGNPYPTGDDAQPFRTFVWDAEKSMLEVKLNSDLTGASTGIAQFHGTLLGHSSYEQAWKDRVDLHFNQALGVFYAREEPPGSGNWVDHATTTSFAAQAAVFAPVVHSESARWGDTGRSPAYGLADWQQSVADRIAWLEARRAIILQHLQNQELAD